MSVSVDATVAGWTREAIPRDRLWSPNDLRHDVAPGHSGRRARGAADVRRPACRPCPSRGHRCRCRYAVVVVRSGRAEPRRSEEVILTTTPEVEIDIPCDVQQVDETGLVWAFLDEARDPSVITEGAIVISADDVDPVLARVVR